jgi:hypothetical protein
MTEEQRSDSGLLDELQSLGQQLTTAVKALWDSEDSRKLRQEIGEGFVELGQQMDSAVKTAQESDAAKQFGEQIKETVDRARESDVADKLEEGLVTGLHELNLGLSKLVTSLEKSAPGEGEPEVEAEAEPVDEAEA